jgi:hypothetical protein
MPFLAPVLMTVFTLALHAVGLPFLGVYNANLTYLRAVKILFTVQLIIATVVYAAIVFDMTPASTEERIGRMEVILLNHSTELKDITAQLNSHTTQLNSLTTLVIAIVKHFNITT